MNDLISRQMVLRCIKESRDNIDWGQSEDGDAFLHYTGALYRTIASEEYLPSAEHHKLNVAEYIKDNFADVWKQAEKELEVPSAEPRKILFGSCLEYSGSNLPSAESEIIRCKDCKHYQFADNRAFGMPVKMCEWFGFEDVDDDDYCSRAERRRRMSDLISRAEAIAIATQEGAYGYISAQELAEMPSAERKGKWIRHGEPPWYVIECSECGAKWQMSGSWDANNFCGNCGDKMKGEEQ